MKILSNEAIINKIIINNLYRTLSFAQYKAKENIVSSYRGTLLLVLFIKVISFYSSMFYMFYSAINTFRTIFTVLWSAEKQNFTVHCSAGKQKFTVHWSLYLLADGPIPLNEKFIVHCSVTPLWRFIVVVPVLADKEMFR